MKFMKFKRQAIITVPFFLLGLVFGVQVLEEVRWADLTLLVLLLWFREQKFFFPCRNKPLLNDCHTGMVLMDQKPDSVFGIFVFCKFSFSKLIFDLFTEM
jgi:hypothetical protein